MIEIFDRGRKLTKVIFHLTTSTGNVLTHNRARFAGHRGQLAACPDRALGAPTWAWLDAAFAGMVLLARPERLRRRGVPAT